MRLLGLFNIDSRIKSNMVSNTEERLEKKRNRESNNSEDMESSKIEIRPINQPTTQHTPLQPRTLSLRCRVLIQRLETQNKTPVLSRKYNAPKNRKIERPEVVSRMILKYHAVRVVDVDYTS